jgi:hypothetical protein
MANSIYDGDFLNNFQSYRNKQRLAGGQIDPRVVGSIAEADLSSRYADQRSRRSQDLQEKSINNQYELGQAGLAQSSAMNNKILDAQKKSAGISNMGSIANILMQGTALGNKLGLYGPQPKESLTDQWIRRDLEQKYASTPTPSLYNSSYAATQGPSIDEWSSGVGYDSIDIPDMTSYAATQGPSMDEWFPLFDGFWGN